MLTNRLAFDFYILQMFDILSLELSISCIISFVLYLEPATFQKDLGHSADNKVMVMFFLFSQNSYI